MEIDQFLRQDQDLYMQHDTLHLQDLIPFHEQSQHAEQDKDFQPVQDYLLSSLLPPSLPTQFSSPILGRDDVRLDLPASEATLVEEGVQDEQTKSNEGEAPDSDPKHPIPDRVLPTDQDPNLQRVDLCNAYCNVQPVSATSWPYIPPEYLTPSRSCPSVPNTEDEEPQLCELCTGGSHCLFSFFLRSPVPLILSLIVTNDLKYDTPCLDKIPTIRLHTSNKYDFCPTFTELEETTWTHTQLPVLHDTRMDESALGWMERSPDLVLLPEGGLSFFLLTS
jgi:hypothetical protein